jgi:membrane-bound lytic murein transglycosylase F
VNHNRYKRRSYRIRRTIELFAYLLALAGAIFYVTQYRLPQQQLTELERVRQAGELVMATRYNPTTYYETSNGPAGFEYEMARAFADYLGVQLKVVVPESFEQTLPLVMRGKVDFAAAGITITEGRQEQVWFAPAYRQVSEQVVYRVGNGRLRKVGELGGLRLDVLGGSSHVERLRTLQEQHPELTWNERTDLENADLLHLVWQGEIDATVADSSDVAYFLRFYPELRVAFDISPQQDIAWAFRKDRDASLRDAALAFFQKIERDGTLATLTDRHFRHVDALGHDDVRHFLQQVVTELPKWRELFEEVGEDYGLDWRFLAAVAYQESHWNPNAVSPTGVRGLMMLTQNTAAKLGIADRTDPRQSAVGGVRYLHRVKNRLPQRIPEPDLTWFGLAAYNVGLGHLEDARRITARQGGNPDRWEDVAKRLPLLSQERWYNETRHGYARGWEPVYYVRNVRNYFDMLVWLTDRDGPRPADGNGLSSFMLPTASPEATYVRMPRGI